jgi:hypothetical protein
MNYRYLERHVTHLDETLHVNVRIGGAVEGRLVDLFADFSDCTLSLVLWEGPTQSLPWSDLGDLSYMTERQRADAVEDLALKYWAKTPPGEGGQ